MTTIRAETILSSQHALQPDKVLYTFRLTYPRWIHAEGRTHRQLRIGEDMEIAIRTPSLMEDPMLSRNASSSRAIPVERIIQDVLTDPAVPLFWGSNQRGMQAGEEINAPVIMNDDTPRLTPEGAWLWARDSAVRHARAFAAAGYHKQIVNRLLEPWMHITVVVSGTEWSNFIALRDHPDAEPHIKMLAREIKKELAKPPMQVLKPGGWHLPFVNDADRVDLPVRDGATWVDDLIKLSVARCASTSYNTVEGYEMTRERATALHDRLVNHRPMHASPLEHVAQADGLAERHYKNAKSLDPVWRHADQHRNFRGFRQYRAMLPGECA